VSKHKHGVVGAPKATEMRPATLHTDLKAGGIPAIPTEPGRSHLLRYRD
jgi:hypothetical protein